jgi:signal transduction histidine kinase
MHGSRQVYSDGLRWATARLEYVSPPMIVGLVLDGRERLQAAARLERAVMIGGGIGALLSCLVGVFFGSYVARQLRRVSESVSRASEVGAAEQEGAPVEIRRVVDALAELLERIRKQEEHTRLMATGLAHDLRSPLQNLVGSTEIVLLRERESEEYRRVLEGHLEDLRELALAIDNLVVLCATRPALGEDEGELFDLAHEVELRLQNASERVSRPDVKLDVRSQGDLALRGDREALLLAVRNLVGNAVRWSPPGGTVEVDLDGRSNEVLVAVEDEGPGIAVEEQELVFEPFRRGKTPAGGRIGYGLGLALTRTAVENHGGSVEVGRANRGGALLKLRLPRKACDLRFAAGDEPD